MQACTGGEAETVTPELEERMVQALEKISFDLREINRSVIAVAIILLFHAFCTIAK